MDENDIRVFNSYRSLFKINFKIYDFGGKVLPRAIPLDALFMTVILFFPLLPVGFIVSPEHPWLTTILMAGGACWLLTQIDPQGKFLPVFIGDFLTYLFRPKTTNLAGKPIRRIRKHQLDWTLPEVVIDK